MWNFIRRHDLAKVWKDDFDPGVALSPDRREGLLEFEATADPALGGAPYPLFVPGKDGRLQIASLRVLQGAGSFFLAQVGGAEGAPYARLSKEEWATQAEAAKALRGVCGRRGASGFGCSALGRPLPGRRRETAGSETRLRATRRGLMNQAKLIGNLGADPVIKPMAKGQDAAFFSMATTERWKDKDSGGAERKRAVASDCGLRTQVRCLCKGAPSKRQFRPGRRPHRE